MMTTNAPYHTLISARMVQHKYKGKDFGLWARLQRITDAVPKRLLTPPSRKVPLGIVSNRRVLIVLHAPGRCNTAAQLAEAMPTDFPWGEGVPKQVQWTGMGRLRFEPEYSARVYIPKRIAAILDRSDLGKTCTARIWHLPPEWVILDLTF